MLFPGTIGLGVTLSLITVFGGIGVLANVLIFYTVAQVMAERRENQERREQREDG
jgi:hypothetical protein